MEDSIRRFRALWWLIIERDRTDTCINEDGGADGEERDDYKAKPGDRSQPSDTPWGTCP